MIPPTETDRITASPTGPTAARGMHALARVPLPLLLPGFTALYFMAGKLGLALAFVHANASAVWPPTGIALAAAIILGLRVWPAIFVGAFLVNVTTPGSTVATSLGIAVGNTLEALIGAVLVQRFAGGAAAFQRPMSTIRFAALAAVLATTVSATIGVLSLWAGGLATAGALRPIWLTWWLGDAAGALLITPLILLWAEREPRDRLAGGWIEGFALAATILLCGWVVFAHRMPNGYIALVPLAWAALRFGRRGAMTASFAMCGIALWGSLQGMGPFVRPSPNDTLLFVQTFVGVITLTALVLATAVRERERAQQELRRAHGELEEKIGERTASLQDAVDALGESRAALNEAQRIAHVGSWEWDVDSNRVTWSDELYRIYGLTPQSVTIDFDGFLDRVHPDDRERVGGIVRAAFESGEPFSMEHRVIRPDGTVRALDAHGRVVRDGERTVGMLGTGQDVTEQRVVEQTLRDAEERFRALAENASDIISSGAPDGTVLYVSPSVHDILGYQPAEFTGKLRMDLVHPDDRALLERHLAVLAQRRGSTTITYRARHKAGHYMWVESVARIVEGPSGEVDRVITVTRDVTERIERARFRELLHGVTAAANEATSAEDAFRSTLTEVSRFTGWPLGHVYVPSDDDPDTLVSARIWHPATPAGHEEFRRVTEATRFQPGVGLPGRVFSRRAPAWIPDVTQDANFPRAKLVTDLGLKAAFGFPVLLGDEVLAVLEFFTTAILPPEPRFLAILGEIGAQLGQVVRRQQVEGSLRRRQLQLDQAQAIAHVGSWEWDIVRDLVTWSDELYRIHGLEPGSREVRYQDFVTHVHPADQARIEAAVRQALEAGGPFEYEYRLVRPDGSTRVVSTQGRVVKDDAGRPSQMFGVCQDMTPERQAQEALRHSEQRYRFLADYSTDLITMLTPEGICTYASPAVASLFGYTAEEIVGMPVANLLHPEDVDAVAAARRAILTSTSSQTVRARLRHKAGNWVWVETTSRGVRDPATGLVVSVVAVTRNVTERVRAEQAMLLLQRVTSIANEAATVDTAMREALEVVGRYAGWPIGHVYVPSRAADGRLTPSDIWYLQDPARFSEFRKLSEMTPLAVGEGLPGAVLEAGKPQWIDDLAEDPTFLRRQAAVALGLRSAFAFPITAAGETLAVVEFFSTETNPMDPELLVVMEAVGAQLGQVVRRQRAEAGLRTSEVRFRALAETANDAIITIDDEGRIVYCNPVTETTFGYAAAELLGRSLEALMPERYRALHRQGLERYVQTGEAHVIGKTIEIPGLHRDGHEVPLEYTIAEWRTEEELFFTGIIRNITDRKESERALNETIEELARSNAELGLFSYVASHDLREPLRTVASNVQLLGREMEGKLTGAARKSLRFALEGTHRMQELIEDLLAYSRVGTEGREFQAIDTNVLMDEVLSGLFAAIQAEKAVVTKDELPTVWADRTQVAQLFQNLLSNALKFHNAGPPRVHVSSARDGDRWVFSVQDEGIGFDPEFRDHIFTVFQRLHAPEEYPGTGIGLAICRKIVERHGGRIWAESEPGKGSVFRFTLPAVRDEAAVRDETRSP